MGPLSLDVGQKTDTAGIFLKLRVVQALASRSFDHRHRFLPFFPAHMLRRNGMFISWNVFFITWRTAADNRSRPARTFGSSAARTGWSW